RILDPDAPSVSADVPLNREINIVWATGALPIEIRQVRGNRLAVDFAPPWRLASPLPPGSGQGDTHLTLTGHLLPGDAALLLPFGSGLSAFRQDLTLDADRFSQCGKQDSANPFAPVIPDPDLLPAWKGVTCVQNVPTGKAIVRLATIKDLP